MFLIYINDLPLEVSSPLSLFADDSKIFSRIVSEKNKKQEKRKNGQNYENRNKKYCVQAWSPYKQKYIDLIDDTN